MADAVKSTRPVIEIWEPTYRMKPRKEERFVPADVEDVIKQVMDSKLKNAKYDDVECKHLSLALCQEIKDRIKGKQGLPRCF